MCPRLPALCYGSALRACDPFWLWHYQVKLQLDISSLFTLSWGGNIGTKNILYSIMYVQKYIMCMYVIHKMLCLKWNYWMWVLELIFCFQSSWGGVWRPWRHSCPSVWRLSVGPSHSDLPEAGSRSQPWQRHLPNHTQILPQCIHWWASILAITWKCCLMYYSLVVPLIWWWILS